MCAAKINVLYIKKEESRNFMDNIWADRNNNLYIISQRGHSCFRPIYNYKVYEPIKMHRSGWQDNRQLCDHQLRLLIGRTYG